VVIRVLRNSQASVHQRQAFGTPWKYFTVMKTQRYIAFSGLTFWGIGTGRRSCGADYRSHVAKKLVKKICCVFNFTIGCQNTHLVLLVCVLVSNSILSFVFQIWSLIVVVLSKKYKQLPHMITTNLLVAQVSSKKNGVGGFFKSYF